MFRRWDNRQLLDLVLDRHLLDPQPDRPKHFGVAALKINSEIFGAMH